MRARNALGDPGTTVVGGVNKEQGMVAVQFEPKKATLSRYSHAPCTSESDCGAFPVEDHNNGALTPSGIFTLPGPSVSCDGNTLVTLWFAPAAITWAVSPG